MKFVYVKLVAVTLLSQEIPDPADLYAQYNSKVPLPEPVSLFHSGIYFWENRAGQEK